MAVTQPAGGSPSGYRQGDGDCQVRFARSPILRRLGAAAEATDCGARFDSIAALSPPPRPPRCAGRRDRLQNEPDITPPSTGHCASYVAGPDVAISSSRATLPGLHRACSTSGSSSRRKRPARPATRHPDTGELLRGRPVSSSRLGESLTRLRHAAPATASDAGMIPRTRPRPSRIVVDSDHDRSGHRGHGCQVMRVDSSPWYPSWSSSSEQTIRLCDRSTLPDAGN
jgi:hypothetical protein